MGRPNPYISPNLGREYDTTSPDYLPHWLWAEHWQEWRKHLLEKHVYAKYRGKPHEKRCILKYEGKFSDINKCREYARNNEDEYAVFCAIRRMKR